MTLGRVSLRYQSPGGRLQKLSGNVPLGDGLVGIEAFGGPVPAQPGRGGPVVSGELGLRLVKAEPGVRLVALTAQLEDFNLRDRFLANGWQSWSLSELLGPRDTLPGLRLAGFLKPYGDYGWVPYIGQPGIFRSHWLTYTTDQPRDGRSGGVSFVGSLNDTEAYTVFWVDYVAGRLWAEFDVDGWEPEPGAVLARLFWAESSGSAAAAESPLLPIVRAFGRRLAELGEPGRDASGYAAPATPGAGMAADAGPFGFGSGRLVPDLDHRPGGWNSWYNYYTKVTQADMLAELEVLRGLGLDYFQIDDGWQATTGDWLTLSPGFADMKGLAAAIRDAGFEPGIWVAPLVTTKYAPIYRQRLVQPWKCGWNPGWRSSIYALDLGRTEARDHVRRVGDAFREWGFGLVKADFLYAAGVRPWGGRTRAQRMREGMRLVRESMPGRLLACGVPLASGAGLCDYARLGPDTALGWDDPLLARLRYRERPSTVNVLRTVLARWFMNGSLYVLDPDVFLFGKGDLTAAERQALYDVTTTFGGLVSFSDSLRTLGPEASATIRRTFPLPAVEVRDVAEESHGLYVVTALRQGRPARLRVNLGDRRTGNLGPHTTAWTE